MPEEKRSGRLTAVIILLCLITAASAGAAVFLLLQKDPAPADAGNPDVYPAVSADPGAEKIGEEAPEPALSNPEGGGAVSLTYSKSVKAERGDAVAAILFANPSKSNQSIVVQLHITDKELLGKIGKTGRTVDAQKIETASGYDSAASRVIIGESGLLAPGYRLTRLRLKPLPDGTVLPAGNYQAVYYILAYDKKTNERAIVNMQIPVVLEIKE